MSHRLLLPDHGSGLKKKGGFGKESLLIRSWTVKTTVNHLRVWTSLCYGSQCLWPQ